MTQALFDKGDKIQFFLEDERIEVPDGKNWVVDVIPNNETLAIEDENNLQYGVVQGPRDGDGAVADLRLHEGTTLDANDRVVITGWEFEYE